CIGFLSVPGDTAADYRRNRYTITNFIEKAVGEAHFHLGDPLSIDASRADARQHAPHARYSQRRKK
ncbi:MAG TPA: hypothetical protein VHG11_08875, partial [Pseudorhizobium sp.]|nr:hypothetical protein [Pseudorhizobium sp.]